MLAAAAKVLAVKIGTFIQTGLSALSAPPRPAWPALFVSPSITLV